MNISQLVENVIKQILNERFDTFNIVPGQVNNIDFLTNQLNFYVNTFPKGTRNYIINYQQMTPQQREIMGAVASCLSQSIEMIVNKVYREIIYNRTYKEQGMTPEDLMMEFLSGGIRKDIIRNNEKAPSRAQSSYGLPVVVGQYLNNCVASHTAINGKNARNYILASVQNLAITIFTDNYKSLDSPKRSDLVRPANNAVTYNNAFSTEPNIDITNIINDKKVGLGPQEKLLLQTLVDINGSKMSKERLDNIANATPTQQNSEIYREISDRTGISFTNVSKRISTALNKAKKSVFATMSQNNPTFTQKFGETPNINIQNQYISGRQISESNNKLPNKSNMRKKIQITESVLRQMIIRAITESLVEKRDSSLSVVTAWAIAVDNGGKDPINCPEFAELYSTLIEHPYCENAVKMGFANEAQSQCNTIKFIPYSVGDTIPYHHIFYTARDEGEERRQKYMCKQPNGIRVDRNDYYFYKETNPNGNPQLKVDKIFSVRPKLATDILNDFFSGLNLGVNEDTKPDSFVGPIATKCAEVALSQGDAQFFTYLCAAIKTYSAHYCRKHYNELAVQWSLGSQQIGGKDSNPIEDEEGNDIKSYDELGNEINVSDESNRDSYTGETKDAQTPEFDKGGNITTKVGTDYSARLVRQVRKIIKDPQSNLSPLEKKILKALIKVATTRMDPQRLEKMQGLSDTQQRQIIYNEISARTGIPFETVQKRISDALNKAKQSKYAKKVDENRRLRDRLIQEAVRRVLANYLK